MSIASNESEILEGVQCEIGECLGVDVDEVTPEARFFGDLQGESIDLIDLMFRCEKRFKVRVELQSLMSDLQLAPDGQISAESVRQLQAKAPEIDWPARVAAICTDDPHDILTTSLISELVQRAVALSKRDVV